MATAGLYETSGDWLFEVGLPGKSGIGGGMVTVSPGKGGLGTFAPRLDEAGNSVKGRMVGALPVAAARPEPVRFAGRSVTVRRHRGGAIGAPGRAPAPCRLSYLYQRSVAGRR